MEEKVDNKNNQEWQQEHDRIKVLWVTSVVVFWLTFAFQIVLFLFNGQVNFILISIIGGMMVIGVALKLKLQKHIRNKSK